MTALILVTPWIAIAGSACVAIPIIIHLLSRRRRPPIAWAAMRFILEAWQARRRRLQLQQILLLLVRCLVPVVLGLALAQPMLSNSNLFGGGGTTVHLVIDNSMTATALDESGDQAIERHRRAALDMIESLDRGDEVSLFPLSTLARQHVIPAQRDHAAVSAAVKRLSATHGSANLAAALEDVGNRIAGDTARAHRVILFSDFREGSGRIDEPLPSNIFESEKVQLEYSAPADWPVEQVRIIDVQPLRRLALREGGIEGLASQSLVQLERDGERLPATITTLTAVTPSGRTTSRQVDWVTGQRETVVDMPLPIEALDGDISPIRVEVGDTLAAQQRHLLVELQDVLRVVILDRERLGRDQLTLELDAATWLERALRPSEKLPIEVRRLDPAAMVDGDLMDADAVFVLRPDLLQGSGWQVLDDFRREGGLVTVSPPGDRPMHSWTEAMREVMDLDWTFEVEASDLDPPEGLVVADSDESVLRIIGTELPTLLDPVLINRVLEVDPGINGVVSLRTDSGLPVLVTESAPGRGTLLLLATALRLDWTSLPAKPLMVPLIQEILRGGLNMSRGKRHVTVGESGQHSELMAGQGEMRHPDGTSLFLDDPEASIDRPGVWLLLGDDGTHRGRIVANVDPNAGDLDRQAAEAIGGWLGETGRWTPISTLTTIQSANRSLVWILLGVLAGLLLLESLLSRWFSPRNNDASVLSGIAGAAS